MSRFPRWPPATCLVLGALLASACSEPSAGAAETVLEPAEPTVLVLRILAGETPLADAAVEVETERVSRKRDGWACSISGSGAYALDGTGRLRVSIPAGTEVDWSLEHPFTLDPRRFAPAVTEELRLTVRTDELFGALVLAEPLAPGEVELDPLVLRPLEVLASGRVLDEEGAPVAGAEVVLASVPSRHMDTWRATTGADGAFAVRVPPGEVRDRLTLAAWKDGRFSAPHPVAPVAPGAPGATDVHLTLSVVPERITGRVLLDPDVPPERLSIQLEPLEAPYRQLALGRSPDVDFQVALDTDGRFEMRCLPGEHRLRIFGGRRQDLAEDSVVHIGPGGAADERLASIDLRGRVRTFRLTLVPPDAGAEIVGSWFAYDPEEREGSLVPFEGESVRIVTAHAEPDVELWFERFRPVTLEDVDGDRTVTLQRGWPVRLVLMDHVPLPEPPVSWTVVLRDEEIGFFPLRLAFAPGAREARGIVTRTGRFELDWVRVDASGDEVQASAWGGRREGPQQALVVRDATDEQVFEIAWVPAPR
jgi:hypothetical protein